MGGFGPPRWKGFTMKLEVHERVTLTGLLPKQEGYAGLKAIRQFRESVSFTPSEVKFYELKTVNNEQGVPTTHWNAQKAAQQIKDIPISEFITSMIRQKLVELEEKKLLTNEILSLYEKFVTTYR